MANEQKSKFIPFYRQGRTYQLILAAFVIYTLAAMILLLTWYVVVGSFEIYPEVQKLIDDTLNTALTLLFPLFFGIVGSFARLLLHSDTIGENLNGVFGSGVIAVVAVLSFESGLISVIVDAFYSANVGSNESTSNLVNGVSSSGQHANILISILAGMFSYNLFSLMQKAADKASN